MVKESGVPTVYSWSASLGEWEKIGEVTGGAGGGGPGQLDGQRYDYVFDVDVEDGAPPRKLALNRGDNPYTVADQFLIDNDLPAGYRDQIVQFILRNTADGAAGGMAAGGGDASTFVDPFTGASAYVPRGYGGGAAVTSSSVAHMPVTGGGADPYTGGSHAAPSPAPTHAAPLIPLRTPLVFEAPPPLDGLQKKLREFATGPAATATSAAEFEPAILPAVARICGGAPPVTPAEASAVLQLVRWPPACLFPVVDVLRHLVFTPGGARTLFSATLDGRSGDQVLLDALKAALEGAAPGGGPALQTSAKLIANLAASAEGSAFLQMHAEALLGCLGAGMAVHKIAGDKAKNVRHSLATALLDFAVVWAAAGLTSATSPGLGDRKLQTLALLSDLLQNAPSSETDTVLRGLVAVGTLAAGDAEAQGIASDFSLAEISRGIAGSSGDAGVKQAAAEVLRAMGRS